MGVRSGTALLPSTKTNLEGADLPAAMASHPILQPVLQMCDGWRDVLCREAKKPYFGRLMEFLNKEETSNQVGASKRRAQAPLLVR